MLLITFAASPFAKRRGCRAASLVSSDRALRMIFNDVLASVERIPTFFRRQISLQKPNLSTFCPLREEVRRAERKRENGSARERERAISELISIAINYFEVKQQFVQT